MATDVERRRLTRLLHKTADGDDAAFRTLYERTAGHVYALLRQMLRAEAQAEEVLQDTYLAVWMRAGEFRASRGSAMTWVITIARYKAIDLIRRRGREVITDEFLEPAISESEEPLALAMGSDSAAMLMECMDVLGAQERRSIELAFFGGASHPEVAQFLGKPVGTVKSWIRRGLQSLKRCLGA